MRRSLRFGDALTPGLVRRDVVQLSVVAALSLVGVLVGPGALRLIVGIVDFVIALLTAVGSVVAWRAVGRSRAVATYAVAALVFLAIGILGVSR